MPYHTAIGFCDERYREGPGGAQCRDDELLRVLADLQGLERGDSHLGDRAHIGIGFASDNDFRIHGVFKELENGAEGLNFNPSAPFYLTAPLTRFVMNSAFSLKERVLNLCDRLAW